MNAALDEMILFEQRQLKVKSWRRGASEKTVAGLDGALSIDLGMRSRELVQRGAFRAVSEAKLKQKADSISLLMDGRAHTLITQDGQRFADLRIDSFEVKNRSVSGSGVCCEFEIKYTQLRD